jgi:hypothetical protein
MKSVRKSPCLKIGWWWDQRWADVPTFAHGPAETLVFLDCWLSRVLESEKSAANARVAFLRFTEARVSSPRFQQRAATCPRGAGSKALESAQDPV